MDPQGTVGSTLMDWEQFVHWLTNPTAIPVAVGVFLSVLVEYVPAFERLAPRWKRAVFFGLCELVPLVGAALGVLTLRWSPAFVETFWPAVMAGVLAFASGTLAHLPRLPEVPAKG